MYESFYGLKAKPFQLSPDPRFFFGSQGHKRAMSYLRYGLSLGEGFIIITGGVGTGKTTLVKALFADLAKENVVASQLVTTNLAPDDTLRMVAASFGLAHEGASKALVSKTLETFLMARAREGRRVLLVVDEAQNLPVESIEELRMISNFQFGGRVLMQTFMLGQDQFKTTLQSPKLEQMRQRIIAAYYLEPLGLVETKEYIEHRLKVAGWDGNPEFSQTAYEEIYAYTRGVPRRINTFCDRLLLYGFLEELSKFDLPQVQEVAGELKLESPIRQGAKTLSTPADVVSKAIAAVTGQDKQGQLEARIAMLEKRVEFLERALKRQLMPDGE